MNYFRCVVFGLKQASDFACVPTPVAYKNERIFTANPPIESAIGAEQCRQVFAWFNGADIEKITRRQIQLSQCLLDLMFGQRHQAWTYAHIRARHLIGPQVQGADDLLPRRFGDGQEMLALCQTAAKMALEIGHAISG